MSYQVEYYNIGAKDFLVSTLLSWYKTISIPSENVMISLLYPSENVIKYSFCPSENVILVVKVLNNKYFRRK